MSEIRAVPVVGTADCETDWTKRDIVERMEDYSQGRAVCPDVGGMVQEAADIIRELRAALMPFASRYFPGQWPDEKEAGTFTVGDFRRAQRAYFGSSQPKS